MFLFQLCCLEKNGNGLKPDYMEVFFGVKMKYIHLMSTFVLVFLKSMVGGNVYFSPWLII